MKQEQIPQVWDRFGREWKLRKRMDVAAESPVRQIWLCSNNGECLDAWCELLVAPTVEERQRFEREVALRTRLRHLSNHPIIQSNLDAPQPFWIGQFESARPLDEWLYARQQFPTAAQMLGFSCQLVECVRCLHLEGYVHKCLQLSSFAVGSDEQVRWRNLASCEPVGPLQPTGRKAFCEHSTWGDIGDMAYLLAELLGPRFLQSPLGKCMTFESPSDRPNSTEVLALLQDLQHNYSKAIFPGSSVANRAA